MTIPKEVQDGMRELILNWDKLNDDTQYSIVGLSEFMGIEKAIELYTVLSAMQVLDGKTQTALSEIGLTRVPEQFAIAIKDIAEA